MRWRRYGLGFALFSAGFIGCADRSCYTPVGNHQYDVASPRIGPREFVAPDLSAVPNLEAVDQVLGPPSVPVEYRILTAEQCQCLAAAHSALGNALARESDLSLIANRPGHRIISPAAPVLRDLLAIRAVDERNKDAARALELFFLLAEAQYGVENINRCLAEIGGALTNYERLKAQGLRLPVDDTALLRQRLELWERKVQAEDALRQLNGKLSALLGLDANDPRPLWATAKITVSAARLDPNAAVALGLSLRPDVRLLALLNNSLDITTLPGIRAGLRGLDPALGVSLVQRVGLAKLTGAVDAGELSARRAQVAQAQDDYRRQAEQQIRQAVDTLGTRLREVALAKEKLERLRPRAERLQQRRATEKITAFDITTARLETLQADYDLYHQVIAWAIAEAKLREAEGALALACGYHLPTCQSCLAGG
jgi:hypothetical protein